MAKLPNPDSKAHNRREATCGLILRAEATRVGRLAREAGVLAFRAYQTALNCLDGGDYQNAVALAGVASKAAGDWARLTRLPLPAKDKPGDGRAKPILDVHELATVLVDDAEVAGVKGRGGYRGDSASAKAQEPSPAVSPIDDPLAGDKS